MVSNQASLCENSPILTNKLLQTVETMMDVEYAMYVFDSEDQYVPS
jgi:hypothetical protein